MKKIIVALLILLMAFSLVSCEKKSNAEKTYDDITKSVKTVAKDINKSAEDAADAVGDFFKNL